MDFLQIYNVPFRKLGLGKHFLRFDIKDDFFEHFKYEDILGADLKADVEIIVQTKGLILNFFIHGTVKVTCDRCLEEFDMDFETNNMLNVEFSDSYNDDFFNDDTVSIPKEQGNINIAKHLFDFIVLGMPIKKVHPDNEDGTPGCNLEMLKFIEEYKPKNTIGSNIKNFDNLKSMFN